MKPVYNVILGSSLLMCLMPTSWATDYIKIYLKTNESNAAAVGFRVNGIEQGGLGKSYNGWGPKDSEYHFGYREDSAFGRDVQCGSLFLSADATVILVRDGETCVALKN